MVVAAKPKILIIDDNENVTRMFRLYFEAEAEIIVAATLEEANHIIDAGGNWDLILLDGCLGGRDLNTEELARKIAAKSPTRLVAIASNESERRQLVYAGCTDQWPKSLLIKNTGALLQQLTAH